MAMDVSSQLNEWIALTAELEDTRELIAKAIYKHYRGGRIVDEHTLELCRRLDDLFKQAKDYEAFLKEDFRSYLEGPAAAPGAEADGKPAQGKGEQAAAKAAALAKQTKAKAMSIFTRQYIKWQVAGYRKSFRETYLEVGSRAIGMVANGQELISDPKIVQLCRYASKVQKDTDHRWEEIQILQRESKKGNMFASLTQSFVVSLTAFSRTQSIPFLNKYLKKDEGLQRKIREQYRKALLTVQSGSGTR